MALVLVASIRIIATYTVLNHTYDEPAHIACGMEWLDKGVYRWEPQHPSLARVATALGPYLLGARSQNTPNVDLASMTHEGLARRIRPLGVVLGLFERPAMGLEDLD